MKIISVVGARPQFVKLAPMARALAPHAEHVIVHTGQHYDPMLSASFFSELDIATPNHHLAIGSGTHGHQTGAMLAALEDVFAVENADSVLVYGDTNSTVAAAIAATKMQIRLHHLEAGLRSFNRAMPEEHNRVLTDHSADLCLAPTEVAMAHLASEGLGARSVLVGDVMTDVVLETRDRVAGSPCPVPDALRGRPFYLATLHRPSNTDDAERLGRILRSLSRLEHPVLLLAHPRLLVRVHDFGLDLADGRIHAVGAASYPDLVRLVLGSAGVITDSGGLQKESFLLQRPCVTVRSETEWTETVDLGWNTLAGDRIDEIPSILQGLDPVATTEAPYGTGDAAIRATEAILNDLAGLA